MATKEEINQAKVEFLNYVEETKEPMFQGYYFTDYTLLCNGCPAFSKLNEAEAIAAVMSLGYTVIDAGYRKTPEPTFALRTDLTEESLKREIRHYLENECEDTSYLKVIRPMFSVKFNEFSNIILKEFDEYEDGNYIDYFDKCLDQDLPNKGFTPNEIAAIKRFILEYSDIDYFEEDSTEEVNEKGEPIDE